jgi:hypothetical protein
MSRQIPLTQPSAMTRSMIAPPAIPMWLWVGARGVGEDGLITEGIILVAGTTVH